VAETSSGSCPVAVLSISSVEPSGPLLLFKLVSKIIGE